MAASGTLSKGITLSYMVLAVPTVLPDLQDIPDLGGSVEKVEITTLADASRRYINGIKDYGDLAFNFLYGGEVTDSFMILSGLETAGVTKEWVVTLPDSTTFTFSGFPSVKLTGAGINAALTFTLNIALSSDIVIA